MSELRQNLATKEWYVIATERARRPEEFKHKKPPRLAKAFEPNCPFCPGNEKMTPPAEEVIKVGGAWSIRVVPNKFSVFRREGSRERRLNGIYREMEGVGIHEVIVETPLHNQVIPSMSLKQTERIVKVYRDRYISTLKDDRIELVIIFKNYGAAAGTSLEHPHSQLIATPLVPTHIRYRMEEARKYSDESGRCVFCDTVQAEREDARRMVAENRDFVAFVPFASGSPFEVWIMPKRHHACFCEIRNSELRPFASILQEVLARWYWGLDDPDFNFVIRSTPNDERHSNAFHWYVKMMPKLVSVAGFELGTGMYVNTTLPEENAEYLRAVKIPAKLG